ncbi:SgcJ/EcaC family oxidoreductase [Streptomyces sp. ADMS]|uniref:SgcJ/EcaC family oxidoreductase n=1 Tax=Streptomyces sp. ADMS TaxID=3071415 RepID=UPI00296F2EC0|nr:SgcJ/EcaC family oxidoreductase [Streptomyces sp. ADMS]MDW4907991.1 SgcJ/EcaC family oxidoreductase [Streptomyces sp. ADMS]
MTRKTRIRAALVTATALATAAAVAVGVSAAGADEPGKPTEKEIAALFDGWNETLQTGDPAKVTDRYADDAVLLPTVSNKIRTNHAEIEDYFHHFVENKPVGTKTKTVINVLDDDSAIDTGSYYFTLTDPKTGEKSRVDARYTYEYEKRDGKWLIVNHHSSMMPEG